MTADGCCCCLCCYCLCCLTECLLPTRLLSVLFLLFKPNDQKVQHALVFRDDMRALLFHVSHSSRLDLHATLGFKPLSHAIHVGDVVAHHMHDAREIPVSKAAAVNCGACQTRRKRGKESDRQRESDENKNIALECVYSGAVLRSRLLLLTT